MGQKDKINGLKEAKFNIYIYIYIYIRFLPKNLNNSIIYLVFKSRSVWEKLKKIRSVITVQKEEKDKIN